MNALDCPCGALSLPLWEKTEAVHIWTKWKVLGLTAELESKIANIN